MIWNMFLAAVVVVVLVIFLKTRDSEKLETNQAAHYMVIEDIYTDHGDIMTVERDTLYFEAEQGEALQKFLIKLR